MCVRRIRREHTRSLEHGMNQTPPISSRCWPLLQNPTERKMEGGKVKPANDVWDRDEVDGGLRYKEMDICKDSLLPATYTR